MTWAPLFTALKGTVGHGVVFPVQTAGVRSHIAPPHDDKGECH